LLRIACDGLPDSAEIRQSLADVRGLDDPGQATYSVQFPYGTELSISKAKL
jgi:hypothetical protein